MTEIKVITKYLKISAKKMQPIANLISGMKAEPALHQLEFMPKKTARFLFKVLASGIANAKHNFGLNAEDLKIKEVIVNQGPSLKRWMPKAMGSATPVKKRTCHVRLILESNQKVNKRDQEAHTDENKNNIPIQPIGEIKSSKGSETKKIERQKDKNIFDFRRSGSGRNAQNVDRIRKAEKKDRQKSLRNKAV